MSKPSVAKGIKLNSFNDLFGTGASQEGIIEIPLENLYEFRHHPFQVNDDDEMSKLVDSVKEKGVLSPILVRKKEQNRYEIISGHRRAHAAIRAELTSVPAIVKELSDDEATVLMVDANIQREEILPSEKAKAYKMKYDAMKNQGVPGNSLQQISEGSGENYKSVQRYIWLGRLNDRLLALVDSKKLGLSQGVSLSVLSEEEQDMLVPLLEVMQSKLTMVQADYIKALSKDRKFTEERLTQFLGKVKEPSTSRKVTINQNKLREYFPDKYTETEIENVIYQLLDRWKEGELE